VKLILKQKKLQDLYPTDIFFQSRYWGDVKTLLGWETYAFDINPSLFKKDMLVLVKPIGRNALVAYVPQGPEHAPKPENYGSYLEELSESIIEQIGPNIAFIRYDLPWESSYAQEMQQRQWYDYPESRIREMRMNFGTKNFNLKKAPVDMSFADTCILNIESNEENLLSQMKPKTRYNIKLAKRKDVCINIASIKELPVFYNLYCETARRNDFFLSEYRYFSALFSSKIKDYILPEILLLLAKHTQDAIAGIILAISEKRAIFLYGASSNNKRNHMGTYALHWEAIRYARSRQCSTYNMGAVSPSNDPNHCFYGLYRFKTGFGGRIFHNNGSWDYPINKNIYINFRNWEMMSNHNSEQGYSLQDWSN